MLITAWNIDPNRPWFVRLEDAGAAIRVDLYLTQADAEAQANPQASGTSSGYGSDLAVILEQALGASVPVALFQPAYSWHLKVSGAALDPAVIYRVREFVDLDEISHPVYRNEDLITTRARAEIDAHTHAVIRKQIELGSHLPTVEPGEIVRLASDRRGKTERLQVMEHRISGEVSEGGEMRLTSAITVAGYLALKR